MADGPQFKLAHAGTPLINGDGKANPARTPQPGEGGLVCPHCTEVLAESEFSNVKGRKEAEDTVKWLRCTQQGMPAGHRNNIGG